MGLILDTLRDVAEFSLLRNFRMRRNQRTAKEGWSVESLCGAMLRVQKRTCLYLCKALPLNISQNITHYNN